MGISLAIILIVISCIIIWKASDGFDTASEYLGRNLGEGVKGATINAIGSSMPELFTTLLFLFLYQDDQGFASGMGTSAGSAIFNAIIIPSAIIFISVVTLKATVTISKKVILRDGISLIVAELVLIYFIGGGILTWKHGVFLILLYVTYVVILFATMKKSNQKLEIEGKEKLSKSRLSALLRLDLETALVGNRKLNVFNACALLLISMLVSGSACFLLVHSCELFGQVTGIPLYFVSVIIASAATSLPDTILSIRDAQKGNYDDALSNAIGSNVFDICFALGFPLLLFTLIYNRDIILSEQIINDITLLQVLLLIMTVAITIIFLMGKTMGKLKAYVLFLMYILFTGFIIAQSLNAKWTEPIIEVLLLIGQQLQLK
ncbi:MAG: sodium:calcium antiporter [Flavobacteriales bacterium]